MPSPLPLLIATSLAQGGVSNWQVDGWGMDAGLPQSSVTAIAPTGDGRLWLGTFAGLAVCSTSTGSEPRLSWSRPSGPSG